MVQFMVRVELHDADDYDTLYMAMEKEGFKKTISSKGIEYDLPTGVYFKKCECTIDEVREAAKRASSKYKRSILVVKYSDLKGLNLKKTKKD